MQYTNPEIPEGINTSKINPLKEFIILSSGIIITAVAVVALLIMLVDLFADKIPFSWEKSIPIGKLFSDKNEQAMPLYLQKVSQKIIQQMALPEGMNITLHYINDNTVNAFATLGGHVYLFRGLLEKLRNEDELSMVIAHEVAHVKYRHPILSLSHGVVVSVVLSLLGSSSDNVAGSLLGNSSMLTLMHFSRDFEYQSDQAAVSALIKIYGHAQGAIGLFDVFNKQGSSIKPVEFLQTHPLTDNRISQVRAIISEYPLTKQVAMTAFPIKFTHWLAAEKTAKH